MPTLTYIAENEDDTARLGAALAAHLPASAVVALDGTLGAGKTRLVQAMAAALGVEQRDVVSPTFTLIQHYQGAGRNIYHFDAYRLRDDDEFLELGPEEYFEADGITVIEWASRVARCLPREHLSIAIEVTGPTARRFTITPHGSEYARAVERLETRMKDKG